MGRRMKVIRQRRGISLADAAYTMGCTTQTLEQIEQGALEEGSTWLVQVHKFSEMVGISLPVLLEGEWTNADVRNLFNQALLDTFDNAFRVLNTFSPSPTIAQCQNVMAEIRRRFELWCDEREAESVIAWRREDAFALDDMEIVSIYTSIRRDKR
jgi:DNA-binding XRE family transcriptional regulator